MRVEIEGGGWVDHCPPPLTKKQLRKRVKELEEQLAAATRPASRISFTQRTDDGSTLTKIYGLRPGVVQSITLHRMYLAVPSGQPVYDLIAVEVSVQ